MHRIARSRRQGYSNLRLHRTLLRSGRVRKKMVLQRKGIHAGDIPAFVTAVTSLLDRDSGIIQKGNR